MQKDVSSRDVAKSAHDGDKPLDPTGRGEGTPVARSASPDAAGQPAADVDGAVSGSGQSTGFGNAGEQPDVDPKGGDGSSLLADNLRKASRTQEG